MTAVMMLLCLRLFYYSIFSCGNNWKLLLFRYVQGEIVPPFHSDCIQLCFQLRYSPYISPKSCILTKVSNLCLRRCMLEFWWKVAVKAGAFQLPINSFTLSIQRRNSRWLSGAHLMSYLVAQSGLNLVFLHICCGWHKTPLRCEMKHTFTHPKNLEMAVMHIMAWVSCVWFILVSNERLISEGGWAGKW